jgi:beta-galactosidase
LENQQNGMLPDVLPTGNFGSHGKERFEMLKNVVKDRPLMCMEFWVGWFDAWGREKHATSNLEENIKDFDEMLEIGNVNIYMFHGGTNFGFMNGSNYYDHLEPDVTSYDYDAVLTEDGQITPKYEAFQKIIAKYTQLPKVSFTTNIVRKAYGKLTCNDKVSLLANIDTLAEGIHSPYPLNMEALGQNYGYILYRSTIKKEKKECKIKLLGATDRALIFANGVLIATKYDKELNEEFLFPLETEETQIDILVENMGRVNFGPNIEKQKKGIREGVLVDGAFHSNWTHYCLPMEHTNAVPFGKQYEANTPAFYRFTFEADELGDTFVDLSSWGKGCVWVNNFLLGRFWKIGPQKRLYIPAPLLKKGTNEIVVFETEGDVKKSLSLFDQPDLG